MNVNIKPTTNDIANRIRQQVFNKINNVPIMFIIHNLKVIITWQSNAVSNHYHADVMGIYGDNAVKLHTEMLWNLLDMSAYDDCSGGPTLAFTVTKPLVRTIPL